MKAPFPYAGGKSAVAPLVWKALGQPKHYIEPCFGSGAVLLARPNPDPASHIETINDADGFVANAWRAMQFAPDEVARWCDWPPNHADLSARKIRLIENKQPLLDGLIADPEWFDAKLAGYWIWAASCWIGTGLTRIGQIPHLGHAGKGVHAIGQRPHLTDAGKGVQEPYGTHIYDWFRQISERLRYVRVVCGDWSRVCGGNWQDSKGTVGIFFDPPYAVSDRDSVYEVEDFNVAHDIRAWAIERGDRPSYRIVIAGYEEHRDELLAANWTLQTWKADGGYANISGAKSSRGKDNKHRECLYFSPHCLNNAQGAML